MNKWLMKAFAGIISASVFIPIARATTIVGPITFLPPSVGTGTISVDATGQVFIIKDFATSGTLGATFGLSNAVGGSTIYPVLENVVNNTGDTWEDFTISMKCGSVPDCAFDPVWFTDGVVPTNTEPGAIFTLGGLTSPGNHYTQLHWVGMDVGPGENFVLDFSITTCENCVGTWTIFETPSLVPEPGTLALLGIALTGIGFSRRRASR